jgi:hypothetical protein
VSKDCLACRIVRHIDVGDGKARADRKSEVGKIALLRTLLAGKGKPSGRIFGSIVLVGVVERVGAVKYPHAESTPNAAMIARDTPRMVSRSRTSGPTACCDEDGPHGIMDR